MSGNSESRNSNLKQLIEDTKEYVKLQADYLRLQSVEKMTLIFSAGILLVIVLMLAMGAMFYLFFTLAYALAPLVGGLSVSFAVITLLYVILIVLLIVFRNRLVVKPILNFLFDIFYTDDEKQNKMTEEDGKK